MFENTNIHFKVKICFFFALLKSCTMYYLSYDILTLQTWDSTVH